MVSHRQGFERGSEKEKGASLGTAPTRAQSVTLAVPGPPLDGAPHPVLQIPGYISSESILCVFLLCTKIRFWNILENWMLSVNLEGGGIS